MNLQVPTPPIAEVFQCYRAIIVFGENEDVLFLSRHDLDELAADFLSFMGGGATEFHSAKLFIWDSTFREYVKAKSADPFHEAWARLFMAGRSLVWDGEEYDFSDDVIISDGLLAELEATSVWATACQAADLEYMDRDRDYGTHPDAGMGRSA